MGGLYEFVAYFSFAIPKFLWIASIIYIYMYIIYIYIYIYNAYVYNIHTIYYT